MESVPKRQQRHLPTPAVPITPLIDIVFLLLVFFMLVTKFLNPSIDLSLPESTTAQVNDEKSVTVAISADGRVAVDDIPVEWAELVGLLRSRAPDVDIVRVRADEETMHREVVRAFDCIRAAGLTEIALEAEKPGQVE
jgi:biopolymer transport protein ExbD